MRSGTGRHRRPRQAPAILVTAGVTSAGLALPLLGASGAQAVEATTWDRVAECESGGVWSANDENGYYGGLQLTLRTWEKYGGTVHAERPDLASRSQQIAVAEKILAEEGPYAWPACALGSGLTEEAHEESDETGAPEEDEGPGLELPTPGPDDSKGPGDTDEPDDSDGADDTGDGGGLGDTSVPSEPDDRDADEGSGTDEGASAGTDSGAGTDEESAKPDNSTDEDASAKPGKPGRGGDQREREEPDGSGASGGERAKPENHTPADRAPDGRPGTGKHRGQPDPAERERPEPGGERPDRSERAEGRYLVERGDSLSSIAAQHEVRGGWPALYAHNERTVGGDPDLILPGQLLDLEDPRK